MNKLVPNYDRSRVPLYVQVASVMRQRVETGHWQKATRSRRSRSSRGEFGVARVTIRQAIEMLRSEGLLDAQQGAGPSSPARPKNRHWLNLANDFESMVDSVKSNVLKRVHIEENVAAPQLAAHEGKPAEGYAFLRSVPVQRRRTVLRCQSLPGAQYLREGPQALYPYGRAHQDHGNG